MYPQFRVTKIRQKHLKIANMIDFNDIFCCQIFSLIQKAG